MCIKKRKIKTHTRYRHIVDDLQGLLDLDAVLLETLIDRFERAQHAELERQQILWERNGPSRTGVPPEDRDPSVLYPASKAIRVRS